jgi:hypothetical protein
MAPLLQKYKKKNVLLSIKILLIYALTLESGIFVFTNTKIGSTLVFTNIIVKNIDTRIVNHFEPPIFIGTRVESICS